MPNSSYKKARLLSASTFSWLLLGTDSLKRTLVTSMIIMDNLSEDAPRLAEGIIEHAAVFTPCITNRGYRNMPNVHLLQLVVLIPSRLSVLELLHKKCY